jgi:hypothetical protein
VTKTPPKDIGASVRARLLRLARERSEDFHSCQARRYARTVRVRDGQRLPGWKGLQGRQGKGLLLLREEAPPSSLVVFLGLAV